MPNDDIESSPQSKGGVARAEKVSKERRSEIAKVAAEASNRAKSAFLAPVPWYPP